MVDVDSVLREALTKRDPREVWAHLSVLRPRLGERDVALAWMTLAQASPRDRQLGADARAVLAAHGGDPDCAIATVTALVRRVDAGGIDGLVDVEAELREGARVLEALAPGAPASHAAALRAAWGNALARLDRDHEAALSQLSEAVRLDPDGPWLSDIILVHKRARRFRAALPLVANAIKRHGPKPALLTEQALVALGAGEPAQAAEALRQLGLTVEHREGHLPFVADLPPIALRVPTRPPKESVPLAGAMADGSTDGARFETLWVQPLSPMHGVVESATFGDAVTDAGDVVLFDVARVRAVARPEGSGSAPLLPFLMVLVPGDEKRLRFLALEQKPGQAEALLRAAADGCVTHLHGARIERVCPRCMAGETLVRHEHVAAEEQRCVTGKIVVPRTVALADLAAGLERAKAAHPGVLLAIPSLYELLGRTAEAGKHHKTWGVIQRGMTARTQP